jgi:fructokinase
MNFNVIGVGEVLWDLLPSGPQLGGAPTNFAYHAHALGANSLVVSRIGEDERGREILRRFREMDLSSDGLQIDPNASTGTASVAIEADGLPHFVIEENVAWDNLEVTAENLAAMGQAHAICFGTLAQRSGRGRKTLQTLVSATPKNALRVFDINLRQNYYSRELVQESLRLSNVLKLNEEELTTLAEMFGLTGSSINQGAKGGPHDPQFTKEQIKQLAMKFDQKIVALTRGEKGSLLYREGEWSEYRSSSMKVVDTVGAGDSFTAALAIGILNNVDLEQINAIANEVARFVCSHAGGTPPMPTEFAEGFSARPDKRRKN